MVGKQAIVNLVAAAVVALIVSLIVGYSFASSIDLSPKPQSVSSGIAKSSPDLVISNINPVRYECFFGNCTYIFPVFVSNVGSSTAGPSTTRFRIPDIGFSINLPTPQLEAGNTTYVYTSVMDLPEGMNLTAVANADWLKAVNESNENNNELWIWFVP